MARWWQKWTCTACGHTVTKSVSYPKYGGTHEPLWRLSLRARCKQCGARGQCSITEEPAKVADAHK